jgi:uncharacterized Tic20 family protein
MSDSEPTPSTTLTALSPDRSPAAPTGGRPGVQADHQPVRSMRTYTAPLPSSGPQQSFQARPASDSVPPPPAWGGYVQAPPMSRPGPSAAPWQPPAPLPWNLRVRPEVERKWATLMHGMSLVALLVPLFGLVAAIAVYMHYSKRSEFVRAHGIEMLNAAITGTIIFFVLLISLVGWLLIPFWFIAALVFEVMAMRRANRGEHYRYPLTFRFIKA